MAKINYTNYGYFIEMAGKIIVKKYDGTNSQKKELAEKDIKEFVPSELNKARTQLDRIEESVTTMVLDVEYLSCLEELNTNTEN